MKSAITISSRVYAGTDLAGEGVWHEIAVTVQDKQERGEGEEEFFLRLRSIANLQIGQTIIGLLHLLDREVVDAAMAKFGYTPGEQDDQQDGEQDSDSIFNSFVHHMGFDVAGTGGDQDDEDEDDDGSERGVFDPPAPESPPKPLNWDDIPF